jgi:hypothetical protein
MRIEEGANTDDNEEYRKSVGLEVGQGNGIMNRSVKGLQNRIVKVFTLDRIDARKGFGLSKRPISIRGNSQPSCMFVAEIGQFDGPIAIRNEFGKVDNHVSAISET